MKKNRIFFVVAALAILAIAILSRFIFLSSRPVHHDEGMLAYFAWKLAQEKDYIYTPQIHAPILFYVQAIIFKLFKAGDYTLRVAPAIFGIILIFIPIFFSRQIGKNKALFLALAFLISPFFLYYSRFLVHSSMVVVFWLAFIFTLRSFFIKPDPVNFYLCFVYLAGAFGTSETTYIFLASVVGFIVPALIFMRPETLKILRRTILFIRENPVDIIVGPLLFITLWVLIYSVGFTNYKSLLISLPNPFNENSGLGFWLAQHPKRLGSQPWYYYLNLAFIYEPLVLAGSVAGIISLFKKRTPFFLFLGWLVATTLVGFSIAGEKFPWLFLCPLMPLTVFSIWYLAGVWQKMNIALKIIVVILALFTAFGAVRLNYFLAADTNELAVYVQTPLSFRKIKSEITQNCILSKSNECVLIDQQITWPLSWDFRDFSSLYISDSLQVKEKTKYILSASENAQMLKLPSKWEGQKISLRDWWVPEKCSLIKEPSVCAKNYLRYFFFRRTWSDKGGYDIYVYRLN